MKITVKPRIDAAAILQKRGLGASHRARIALAETAVQLAQDYVPRDTGRLAASAEIAADGAQIRYTAPYAKAQYYGTAAQYHNNEGGLRGRLWMARMQADHKTALQKAVASVVGGCVT